MIIQFPFWKKKAEMSFLHHTTPLYLMAGGRREGSPLNSTSLLFQPGVWRCMNSQRGVSTGIIPLEKDASPFFIVIFDLSACPRFHTIRDSDLSSSLEWNSGPKSLNDDSMNDVQPELVSKIGPNKFPCHLCHHT